MGYGRSHQGIRSGASSSERNGGEQGRTVATGSHGRTSLEPVTASLLDALRRWPLGQIWTREGPDGKIERRRHGGALLRRGIRADR